MEKDYPDFPGPPLHSTVHKRSIRLGLFLVSLAFSTWQSLVPARTYSEGSVKVACFGNLDFRRAWPYPSCPQAAEQSAEIVQSAGAPRIGCRGGGGSGCRLPPPSCPRPHGQTYLFQLKAIADAGVQLLQVAGHVDSESQRLGEGSESPM